VQIELPDRKPTSGRDFGPGDVAVIFLVLFLAGFALAFAPAPGSGEGAGDQRLASICRATIAIKQE
jgi:hypothetical protein